VSAGRRGEPSTKRAALASGAAIAVAIGAGAFALAANLGWLSSSAGARVGTLSAAQDLASAPLSAAEPAGDPASATGGRSFVVSDAGRVFVTSAGGNLVLASVHAEPGWSWQVLPEPAGLLAVSFTNGSHTFVLRAATAADGSIASVVREGSGTAATTSGSHNGDAQHEREGHGEDD
jgi:hypothetical protein